MPATTDHVALILGRSHKAQLYLRGYVRYLLGYRGRPSAPVGLSEKSRDAVRLLAEALVEEE